MFNKNELTKTCKHIFVLPKKTRTSLSECKFNFSQNLLEKSEISRLSIQCDQMRRVPAKFGGFWHLCGGQNFGVAVGGCGGLLHKMRK